MSILPAVVAGMGAALGGVGGYLGAKEQNASAQQIANQQMEFQERMSSTAYQRAMQDMRAAGLNPILAYSQGGASTPSGASFMPTNVMESGLSAATDTARTFGQVEQAFASAEQSGAQTGLIGQQAIKTKAEVGNVKMDTLLKEAAFSVQEAQKALSAAQTERERVSALKTALEARAIKATLPRAENRAKAERAIAEGGGALDAVLSRLLPWIH